MTYAEFLKSQGATDEDIKVLDTALGRKGYERMIAESAAARAEADRIKADAEKLKTDTREWFDKTAVPEYKIMEAQAIAARANEARMREAWKTAQERGLIDVAVAQELGIDVSGKPPATPKKDEPPPFDASKYVSMERLGQLTDSVGDGLATLQDIVMEHQQLFPTKPLRTRELRREAVAANKTVEQYWMDKFNVAAAREARETAARKADEDRLRKEGHDAAVAELAGRYANPDARPLAPSNSPFTKRVPDGKEAPQPWNTGRDNSDARVASAVGKQIERQSKGVN